MGISLVHRIETTLLSIIRTSYKYRIWLAQLLISTCTTAQAATENHHLIPLWADKKIHLCGVTITPGGYLAGEGLWRSRNEQSDIGSTFSGIPVGNNPLYYMHEFRLSARQSRVSALIEGQVNPCTLLSGYYEADFLGNGTGNSNESNSYDLRIRNVYLTLDKTNWGFHVLAGQNWSLATTNTKGITPRNESIPPTIDAQYVVGFVWKRQAQFRFTQNFCQNFWVALSFENPQTTFGGTPCGTVLPDGTTVFCSAPGAQTLPNTTVFSLNQVPDVIGKIAYEALIKNHNLHLEVIGLYRDFYDRIQRPGNIGNRNINTTGEGFGGGIVAEILPKLLDFQGNMLVGHGIGSYGAGQLPDVTIGSTGKLAPIPETIFMLGAILHATCALDMYLYYGQERESRKYFQVGSNFFGYGVPNANNRGCSKQNGICAGNTSTLWQITTGLWGMIYRGRYGDFKGGLQYSYTKKILFPGNGGKAKTPIGYNTDDHMVFFSLRYYPFV